jgi:CRP-like cAMP-binding protein
VSFPRIVFRIIENRRCPLYHYGDEFSVTGIAISMNNGEEQSFFTTSVVYSPAKKEVCKILTGDLTRLVIQYERGDKIPVCLVSCSGCTGSIKLEHSSDNRLIAPESPPSSNEIGSMMHLFSDFAFFRNIENHHLEKVVQFFRLSTYRKGDIILRKGESGGNFFIIVTGGVNVINEVGITISKLGKGDVFGEMSLICNEKVSATIQAREETSIIYIDKANFKRIIDQYPTIQLYFSRLMASRLNKANMIRTEDLSSAMIGNLTEIPAEALFQTLNMNSKTGILTISELPRGTARFSFRQGSLIKAKYDIFSGEAAFYEILKEHQGRFRFTPGIPPEDFEIPEIGYFMKLLIEGMRRIDETRNKLTN